MSGFSFYKYSDIFLVSADLKPFMLCAITFNFDGKGVVDINGNLSILEYVTSSGDSGPLLI